MAADSERWEKVLARRRSGISPNALTAVIVIIVVVWAVSFLANIFVAGYQPPTGINEIMIAIVGFLFAGRQAASHLDEDDSDDEPQAGRKKKKPDDSEGAE